MFAVISSFDVVAALIVWNFLKEKPANLKIDTCPEGNAGEEKIGSRAYGG
jgi:hypothetical protein